MNKKIQLLLFVLMSVLATQSAIAQTPQFFNANTSNSNNNWPLNAASQINNRCQWNYGPNLFSSLGGGLGVPAYAGLITDVYFRLGSSVNPTSVYDIDMAIGQNVGTQISFANGTYITGLTPILNSTTYSLTGATTFSWYKVTLPTPILYNPSASMVFEIYQAGTGGGNLLSQNTSLPGNRIYGGTAAVGGVLGNGLVDFGFDLIPNTPCIGMPNAGTTTGPTNPCPGVLSTYFLTGATLASGLSYQWIRSTVSCAGPWTIMLNDTNSSMSTLPTVGMTTYYRCVVTCDSLMLSDTSSCLAVTPQTWSPWSPCFCYNSAPTIATLTDIGQFTMGTLVNPSVAPPQLNNPNSINTYSNFDTLTPIPTYIQGQSYPVTVFQTCSNNVNYTGWTKVFIDYNHNTSWSDLGEEVFSSSIDASNSYAPTGMVTIPTNALPGLTRLRAVLRQAGNAANTLPCGSYTNYGETEDYIVNILSAGPHDPAITNIQVNPTGGCMDSFGTVILTCPNYGSAVLDFSINPLVICLNVNGPNGLTVYKDTLTSGILQPFSLNNTFSIIAPVNFYTGGTYTINTDTLTLLGSTNSNLINDSLFTAITVVNSRPNNVGDYALCIGDSIPTGNGLSITNCPTGLVQDSVLIPFTIGFGGNTPPNPTLCAAIGAGAFASATLPNLPPGANILSGDLSVNNLQLAPLTFTTGPNLTRFSLHQGGLPTTAANVFHTGLQGNPLNALAFGCFNYLSTPPAVDLNLMYNSGAPVVPTVNMGHWSTNRCTATNILANCGGTTVAYLKLVYEYIPMGVSWYEQPSGGVRISDSSVLNPLLTPNTIVNNSNTPGIFTFYGACAADTNCRVESSLIITGLNFVSVLDTNVDCFGASTGSVQALGSGGVGTLMYTLTQGATVYGPNSSGYFGGLTFGNYTLNIVDSIGCGSGDSIISITQPAALSITNIVSSTPSCTPGNDATISVTATGGTGGMPYDSMYTATDTIVNNNVFLNQGGGIYMITVVDANGCTATSTHTIIAPGAPTWNSVTTTNVLCFGDSSGSINMSTNPGTNSNIIDSIISPAPWVQSVTGGTVTGLPAGIYIISATDGNGCAITSAVVINAPPALNFASIGSTDVVCSGDSNGTITVSGSGGIAPYTFNINPNPATASQPTLGNFIGLPADTYIITMMDSNNNCSATTSIVIAQPASLSFTSVVIDSANCNGVCDGGIVVNGAGGVGPLTYSIVLPTNIPSAPSGTFANLCANTFTVRITNGTCILDSIISVLEPTAVSVSSSSTTNILCKGDSTGSITVVGSGGTPTYMYSINTVPVQSNSTGMFSNLPAGSYILGCTDSKGCNITTTVILTEPTTNVSITNVTGITPSCNPGSDGIITVTATGGTGSLTYQINNSSDTAVGYFDSLNSGNFILSAFDANGCKVDSLFNLSNSSAPTWSSVTNTNVLCNGDSTACITSLAVGGGGGMGYSLSPYASTQSPIGTFCGLPLGTYTITATDANNCSISSAVVITQPTPLSFVSVVTDSVDCNGASDGKIIVLGNGGAPNLNYSILPSIGSQSPVGTFNNLPVGQYIVRITDNNNCTLDSSVSIYQPTALQFTSASSSDVLCNGDANGSLITVCVGGTGAIQYAINTIPIQTSINGYFANLSATTYIVTASDAKNCTTTVSITINQPAPLGHNVSTTNVLCYSEASGVISFPGNGGVAPYSYTLFPNNISNTTGTFTSLSAGSLYKGVIIDSNGCTDSTALITITEPTQMVFTNITKQDIECYGASTGSATVMSSGGTGQHVYTISPNPGPPPVNGTFNGLPADNYIITATDDNNCTITINVTIIENPPIVFDNITHVEPQCYGDETGSISFSASGGVGSFLYIFDGTFGPNTQTTYTDLGIGIYTIRAIDSLGCIKDTAYDLSGPDRINYPVFEISPVTCEDTEDGKLTIQAAGGRGNNYTYSLEPGFYVNVDGFFRDLKPGFYVLRTLDEAGCFLDTTFQILMPLDPLVVSIQKEDLTCFGRGNEGKAEAIVSGGTPPYTFFWNSTPVQTTAIVQGLYHGNHTVDIVDAAGCLVREKVVIEPGPCCEEVFLPNAFSPNNDGVNDEFRILSTAGIELIQFEVRNRWGVKVWETNNTRSAWDGQYGGQDASIGSYYYVVRYKCLTDSQQYIIKGDVIIIR